MSERNVNDKACNKKNIAIGPHQLMLGDIHYPYLLDNEG